MQEVFDGFEGRREKARSFFAVRGYWRWGLLEVGLSQRGNRLTQRREPAPAGGKHVAQGESASPGKAGGDGEARASGRQN